MWRIFLVLFIGLMLSASALFAGSSFSRSRDNSNTAPFSSLFSLRNSKDPKHSYDDGFVESEEQHQAISEEEEDPDMPKGRPGGFGGLDKQTYMRLRDEYISRRRGLEPGLPFDAEARGRAIQQMQIQETFMSEAAKRLQAKGPSGTFEPNAPTAANWLPIGPAPLPNGFGGFWAGRVTSVVVDPTNSNTIYVGTAQGGVWRSDNGGTLWFNLFSTALTQSIGSLAIAPSDHTILYVGTGESNRSGDSFFGIGVYRIDNANGSLPTLVGPINPWFTFNTGSGPVTTKTFSGRSISQIVVHPTQPGTIFVGTSTGVGGSGGNALSNTAPPIGLLGLYRSTNANGPLASITFQKLAVATAGASLDVPGTGNRRITDLVMEPGNPDNLIVGVFGAAAPNDGGIFRSTNATAPNPTFNHALQISIDRIQLAINKNTSTGVVKVLAATGEAPSLASCSVTTQAGVLRQSMDGGATWPGTDATANTGGILTDAGGFCGGQCFYNVTVAIDPRNANSIYLGGNVQSTCSGLMLRSQNGVTFQHDASGLHADSHALFFDTLTTPSTIITGNDGGVWKRSADAPVGTTWNSMNTVGLNSLQFESVAVHPIDRYLTIGGTQDNGTEVQTNGSGNWFIAEGGDGGYALIDQSATDTTNVTMYHTFFNRTGTQIGFDRIINVPNCLPIRDSWPTRGDFGVSDQPGPGCDGTANVINNGISRSDTVLFYAPMALGPGTPNTVYFGTDRLYRSDDRGDHMIIVSPAPVSGSSPISTIAISRQDDNYRLIGLQNGQVFATATGSATLVNLTSGLFPANPNGSLTNKFVGRAVFDPSNKDVAYIAFSFYAPSGQGVWKITNLGAAAGATPVAPIWTPAGGGIPSVPINALAIDPLNPNHIFAGTDIGVYDSTDGGAIWNPYGSGLPRSTVFDLAIQSPNRILRAATHGRGIWEVSIPNLSGPNSVQFSSSQLNVSETLNATTKVDINVTRAGDSSGVATIDYATVDGTANDRSDYLAARGTLHFDSGQTTKTISVFVVDDRYGETDENFSVVLGNPVGCTLSSPANVNVTIASNEAVNGANPVKWDAGFDSDFFVRQHYIDFFSREPDPGGLAFWKNQIDECTTTECREIRRTNVSAAFFLSIEFQQTGYLVERLYKVAYGSALGNSTFGGNHQIAVPVVRFNEFLADTQQIGRGVIIGQPGAGETLEKNKQTLISEFVLRSRFLTTFPLSMSTSQFVDTLNANSGGALSQLERDQLVLDLTYGAKTRAEVLRAVAEDSDLFNSESNRAFVLVQYFGYLRRNPNDAPENGLDYTGFDFWLSKLNQFNGNFVNAEMVKAFIVSGEYQQRFGP